MEFSRVFVATAFIRIFLPWIFRILRFQSRVSFRFVTNSRNSIPEFSGGRVQARAIYEAF
jgi:hypothetical protein